MIQVSGTQGGLWDSPLLTSPTFVLFHSLPHPTLHTLPQPPKEQNVLN